MIYLLEDRSSNFMLDQSQLVKEMLEQLVKEISDAVGSI